MRHLVTDDRHLRKGIGRAIMAAAHDQARAAGVRVMDCNATRTAEPFYAAMGYRRLGEITVELRPGISFPAVQMQRRLCPTPTFGRRTRTPSYTTKKAGVSAGPFDHVCRLDHSRWPNSDSSSMNMLMKFR